MTISLAKDVEAFLEEQIRAGAGPDPSAIVNDLLRTLCEHRQPLASSPEIEDWLLEAAAGTVTPLGPSDFQALRQRVRDRLATAPE